MEQIINSSDYSKILKILEEVKNKSVANKRKVGALLVNLETQEILASGFNHNQYIEDNCENFEGETFDTVIHAEANLILSLTHDLSLSKYIEDLWDNHKPLSMFITFSPCIECAKLIVQYGKIKNIFIMEEHERNFRNPIIKESLSTLDFLIKQNINVFIYNKITKKFIYQNNYYKNVICVYHSKDLDGFMSYLLFKHYITNDEKCFGYSYEEQASWIDYVKNNKEPLLIYFGDITPNLNWFEENLELLKSGNIKIIFLDHHKNKLEEIYNFVKQNKLEKYFSFKYTIIEDIWLKNYSGCELVLRYILIRKNFPVPKKIISLCDIIGAWDTWRWNEPDFEYDLDYFLNLTTYLLFSYHSIQDFTTFVDNELNNNFQEQFKQYAKIGKIISKTNKTLLQDKINKGLFKKFYFDDNDKSQLQYIVIVEDFYPKYNTYDIIKQYHKGKNLNNFKEDNNYLYITFKTDLNKGKIIFSVRSYIKNKLIYHYNAIDIAKQFKNGGGHEEAAGFTLSIKDGLEFLKTYNLLTDI